MKSVPSMNSSMETIFPEPVTLNKSPFEKVKKVGQIANAYVFAPLGGLGDNVVDPLQKLGHQIAKFNHAAFGAPLLEEKVPELQWLGVLGLPGLGIGFLAQIGKTGKMLSENPTDINILFGVTDIIGNMGALTDGIAEFVGGASRVLNVSASTANAFQFAGGIGVCVSALTICSKVKQMVDIGIRFGKLDKAMEGFDGKNPADAANQFEAAMDRFLTTTKLRRKDGKQVKEKKPISEGKMRAILGVSGNIPFIQKKFSVVDLIRKVERKAVYDQDKELMHQLHHRIKVQQVISLTSKSLAIVAAIVGIVAAAILSFTPFAVVGYALGIASVLLVMSLLISNKVSSEVFLHDLRMMIAEPQKTQEVAVLNFPKLEPPRTDRSQKRIKVAEHRPRTPISNYELTHLTALTNFPQPFQRRRFNKRGKPLDPIPVVVPVPLSRYVEPTLVSSVQ